MFGCKSKKEKWGGGVLLNPAEVTHGKEGVYVLTYRHEACGHTWTKVSNTAPDTYDQQEACPKCYPSWLSAGAHKTKPMGLLIDARYEGPSIR